MPAASQSIRALDRLKKAANLVPVKKTIELSNGEEFEFWHTSLTMAERERAAKIAGTTDPNAFAIQLLVQKALDENGNRMFQQGDVDVLKNEVRDSDLQKMILAMIQDDIVTVEPGN
jgi:hypothetical protein